MSHRAKGTREHTIGAPVRGAGVITESQHDPYRSRHKPAEPTVCPECRAVFHEGRWQWTAAMPGAHEELCPACRRIRDRFPAGFVTLEGGFLQDHRAEVMDRVRSHAERVKSEHPLERIMDTEEVEGGVRITTTDLHLARGIGEALESAYRGKLEFHYEPGQYLVRVHWQR